MRHPQTPEPMPSDTPTSPMPDTQDSTTTPTTTTAEGVQPDQPGDEIAESSGEIAKVEKASEAVESERVGKPSPFGGYVVKPRWKKGESGNPRGSRPYGATLIDWINRLQFKDEATLRAIAKQNKAPAVKRAACVHLLETIERPDPADFVAVADGRESLLDARKRGLATDTIKKLKRRTRTVGEETVTESELEFHDRGITARDKAINHTAGTPIQRIATLDATPRQDLDLSKLSTEQLETLSKLLELAQPGKPAVHTPPLPEPT